MPKSTGTSPDIPILYEDDQLLVIDKPVNLLSQKDYTNDPDVVTLCKKYISVKQGVRTPYLGLVHRLDRPVGGVMVLAKKRPAADKLSRHIRDQRIQKTYWAVVYGQTPANDLLTHALVKDQEQNLVSVTRDDSKDAKRATLTYKRLESTNKWSLLAVYPQTGRSHQIRVQLSETGYPIWGDYKYGNPEEQREDQIALRSVKISFLHPGSGTEVEMESYPPESPPWNFFRSALHQ